MADKSLNRESEGLHVTEALRLDDLSARLKIRDLALKERVAGEILEIFKWANIATIALVVGFAIVDLVLFCFSVPGFERLITSEVIMALIGATVVQAGAAAFAIAISLFPRKGNGEA